MNEQRIRELVEAMPETVHEPIPGRVRPKTTANNRRAAALRLLTWWGELEWLLDNEPLDTPDEVRESLRVWFAGVLAEALGPWDLLESTGWWSVTLKGSRYDDVGLGGKDPYDAIIAALGDE